jgi:hypothetical protein
MADLRQVSLLNRRFHHGEHEGHGEDSRAEGDCRLTVFTVDFVVIFHLPMLVRADLRQVSLHPALAADLESPATLHRRPASLNE